MSVRPSTEGTEDATPAVSVERGALVARIRSAWRAFRRDGSAVCALVFVLAVVGLSLLAPYISPYDPTEAVASRNAPPGAEGLLLGADGDGRDVLSRLLWGGRIALVVGVVPTLLATCIGLAIGVVVGYAGGWVDHVAMRLLDMFFAFPLVLVAIVVAGVLSPSLLTIMIAMVVALVPYITRLVRTTTISVSTQSYVEAARAGGASAGAILTRYVLPNTVPPVVVYTTTLIGMMMVLGSALSFLGLGVQPPTADWGLMVAEGRTVLKRAPHVTIFPGLAIVLVSLSFGFIGDGLRDALDPRARGR